MSSVEEIEEGVKRQYTHYEFRDIYEYLTSRTYPDSVETKGEKSNFRRASKPFVVVDKELKYQRRQKDGSINQVQLH